MLFQKALSAKFSVRTDYPCLIAGIAAAFCILISSCVKAPLPVSQPVKKQLVDGTYEGVYSSWPNKATVEVTIRNGSIVDVRILSHWASWIGKRAEAVIPLRIVEKQSTNVDAVSGATNSSRVIMNAAQNALEKAYGNR